MFEEDDDLGVREGFPLDFFESLAAVLKDLLCFPYEAPTLRLKVSYDNYSLVFI